ncbi:MAG: metalloregulator ArsR/SmtB family transcription factor, partial [Gemmatimonadetes bacterium]|nr:metalloregulator ArsR/SmtB family transcription factor [Gemmatimonadota bacterium]
MASARPRSRDPLQTAVAPRRLQILRLIWAEERTVGAIAAELPVSVPAVSQHLGKLRDAGLVAVRKDGRRRFYAVADDLPDEVDGLLQDLLGSDQGRVSPPTEAQPSDSRPPGRMGPEKSSLSPAASEPAIHRTPGGPLVPAGRLDDEMVSWYRQGLSARVVALRTARSGLAEGRRQAAESVRRLADSLTRPAVAERFPEIARTATATRGESDALLAEATDRLIGAISQEIAIDDPRVARILVVEDSRVEAALTRSIVSGPNREVLWAQSAEEAQQLLDQQDIDLILLDLGLPGEDGRDLLGRLGRRPRTRAIPVILLTGRTDLQTRTEVMSLGADAFFTKPADGPVLASAVAMMLERSAESRQAGRQDPLTGLSNRTVFLTELKQVAAAAKRADLELSLAILDTDRLAAINDVHGSDVGDDVVRSIAQTIRSSFRESDHAARWGGGKFAIFFSHTGEAGAATALGKLRAATDARPVVLPDGSTLTPEWHAGVATVVGSEGIDDAIARATRRLNVAERQRDGRIVASDEATADGPRHVLLVEDDDILADLIRHRLGREGFDVTHFSDGAVALRSMAEITASAVILDVMLPGADGFEILRQLKSQPSFAGVPVVVLTFGGAHDARRA